MGSYATYPHDADTTNIFSNASISAKPAIVSIQSDSSPCTVFAADYDKENRSPNRPSKRLSEKMTMRQTLKWCRGTKTVCSTEAEKNQIVSCTIEDPSDSLDKSAEAVFQPRTHP